MSVRWEDPPRRGGEGVDWAVVGAELKTRPGEWAHVATYQSSNAAAVVTYQINSRIKHPRLLALGAFEAKARTVDGDHRVYARYVGEAGERSDTPNPSDFGGDA